MNNTIRNVGIVFVAAIWAGVIITPAQAEGAPKIEFDRKVYDFGKTSIVQTVTGVFKIKNVGGSTLKIEEPKPSCGCTVAGLKPDKLEPGETGELSFTLQLGHYRSILEKQISVRSNDPLTPEVVLAIKAEYTPLYDANPMALVADLPLGLPATNLFATITRTDGKPCGKLRFQTSQAWISAKLADGAKANSAEAQVQVAIRREGVPRRFNEFVHIYSDEQTNSPVSSIYLYGQVTGQIVVAPEALYWSVPQGGQRKGDQLEAAAARHVTIRAADGKPFQLQNPTSTYTGVKVQLLPKNSGKEYELIARLNEPPNSTLSGSVSLQTSVASQPKIELPLIINVLKAQN